MGRIDKHNYYLGIAESVLKRATCLRRNYGCVIVNNDEIYQQGIMELHVTEKIV